MVHGFNQMTARLRQGDAAEKEAQRLQMERAEQLAAVGQMAAGLAHEIRNPLSSVRAVLEVVAQDMAGGEKRDILRDAAGELDRLDQIVRDLLQYARPRAPAVARLRPERAGDRGRRLHARRGRCRRAARLRLEPGEAFHRSSRIPTWCARCW